ncbi:MULTISPECIES: hypothetical protein [unclassified Staphylococcus]|uniref:hypothetical protein n=1 Tax=unclassified Staphylococcus TaxID=91994 RepID=UPI0021D2C15F|nr:MULTISPECIES: hypothetical protein [unclassified Staphylococcus]UXR75646.1 hypothetical protein MUA74_08220 [Staphylococcus sp. IVB6233]UXR79019.1 hypothetical protein MUA92_03775 [Staphylococcus sp. IVB6227]UXR83181.1 hypothetical protein MUA51_03765 [Staphylococcus sp. IVB6214]
MSNGTTTNVKSDYASEILNKYTNEIGEMPSMKFNSELSDFTISRIKPAEFNTRNISLPGKFTALLYSNV